MPKRAEAVAMRREIIRRGYWLSPLNANVPLPTLSEYEATADLQKMHAWQSTGGNRGVPADYVEPPSKKPVGRPSDYERKR